ncbi:MAG: LysR family transcriptional regulator [Pseudooceanicola atlanticus]
MDLRQLRYFLSVAREGSFNKASEKLRIAQPALSRHIQSLEYEVGVELLVRTPRGVEPTESGRLMMEKADFVLGYVADIKPSVGSVVDAPAGEVALGIAPSLASTFALRIVQRVKESFPHIHLRIVEGLSIMLFDWIDQAKVDLALATDFGSFPGVERRELGEDQIVFVGPPELLSETAESDTIDISDVVNFPLVLTQGFHQLITPRLFEEGVEVRYEMEISSTPIVRDLALDGGFCTIIASSVVKDDVQAGRLVAIPFSGRPIPRRVVTAYSSVRHISRSIKAVEDIVRDELLGAGYFSPPQDSKAKTDSPG